MTDSVAEYVKRPVRYNMIDGVDEMLIGFLFLALTLLMHVANVAPEGSIWRWKPLLLITNALLLIPFFLGRRLLKERITYRRTGYVKYRYSKTRSVIGGVVGFVVGVAVTVAIYRFWSVPERERYLILTSSLLWTAFYAYFFVYKTQMYRIYRYVIVLLMAIGPWVVYSVFRNVRDISTLSGAVLGACFLISGVITFLSYLYNTKPDPRQPADNAQ